MSLQRIQEMNILVEPEAATLFERADAEARKRAVERLSLFETKPLTLNAGDIKKLLIPEPKLLKRLCKPNEMSVNDLTTAWTNRFAAIQQMLLRRPETSGAMSVSAAAGGCTLIGQVRVGKGTELEDPTGSIPLIAPTRFLADDVIAAKGRAENGIMHAEEILFPDVPLKSLKELSVPLPELKKAAGDATAAWLDIDGATVLVVNADWAGIADKLGIPIAQVPVELLRRRHMAAAPWDVIDPAPDIMVAVGLEGQLSNYKGTRIVGTEADK